MFQRLNQVARHVLTRPLPAYTRTSAFSPFARMSGNKSMIHTAGCLIIGDEVLGGKVSL